MSYFRSGFMLAARALAAKDWSHPHVLAVVRKAAHGGASAEQIRDEFWPDVTIDCARDRCRKFNIRPRRIKNRARFGYETGLSNHNGCVSTETFKPRIIGEHRSL